MRVPVAAWKGASLRDGVGERSEVQNLHKGVYGNAAMVFSRYHSTFKFKLFDLPFPRTVEQTKSLVTV